MVDANQAWNLHEAIEACKLLEDLNLCWLEEPIPANSEIKEWIHLKDSTKITLAAGENFNSHREFSSFFKIKSLATSNQILLNGVALLNVQNL